MGDAVGAGAADGSVAAAGATAGGTAFSFTVITDGTEFSFC